MRSARELILKSLAIAVFAGLTMGGTARLSVADSGTEPVYHYAGARGTTSYTAVSTGSGAGAGGWVESGYTSGTEPVYRVAVDDGTPGLAAGVTESAGSAAGGPVSGGYATGTDSVYRYAVDRGSAGSIDHSTDGD